MEDNIIKVYQRCLWELFLEALNVPGPSFGLFCKDLGSIWIINNRKLIYEIHGVIFFIKDDCKRELKCNLSYIG